MRKSFDKPKKLFINLNRINTQMLSKKSYLGTKPELIVPLTISYHQL